MEISRDFTLNDSVIRVVCSVGGREIVYYNGQEVSRKRSAVSSRHDFSVDEDGQTIHYNIDFKSTWSGYVLVNIRRNGLSVATDSLRFEEIFGYKPKDKKYPSEKEDKNNLSWLSRNWQYILLLLLVIYAVQTKPPLSALEQKVRNDIRIELSQPTISNQDGILSTLLKLGCTANLDDCVELLRRNVRIVVGRDWWVARFAGVHVSGSDSYLICAGAFDNWSCWSKEYKDKSDS